MISAITIIGGPMANQKWEIRGDRPQFEIYDTRVSPVRCGSYHRLPGINPPVYLWQGWKK